MAIPLYRIKEGETAPRVPHFLRGKFFELVDVGPEGQWDKDGNPVVLGWLNIMSNGTIEIGEPGE